MKRDWDLMRQQLLAIEEDKDFRTELLGSVTDEPRWKNDQDEAANLKELEAYRAIESRIFGHLELLVDNGFINGLTISRGADGSFYYSITQPRLTMAGHDLLDTMRSDSIWSVIKSTAKTKGVELTFDSIKALGAFALKALLAG